MNLNVNDDKVFHNYCRFTPSFMKIYRNLFIFYHFITFLTKYFHCSIFIPARDNKINLELLFQEFFFPLEYLPGTKIS